MGQFIKWFVAPSSVQMQVLLLNLKQVGNTSRFLLILHYFNNSNKVFSFIIFEVIYNNIHIQSKHNYR